MVKIGITVFPGSNCERDVFKVFKTKLKIDTSFIKGNNNVKSFDAIIIPGGFTYGDRLRAGAIAAHSPLMDKIRDQSDNGIPILGICNGFQILVESGLLPGALIPNDSLKFICKWANIMITNNKTPFTNLFNEKQIISIPIAHGEGRYMVDKKSHSLIKENEQIIMKYYNENPNGSIDNIAGISNIKGNILGMMPHPERASYKDLVPPGYYNDAITVFKSLVNYISN